MGRLSLADVSGFSPPPPPSTATTLHSHKFQVQLVMLSEMILLPSLHEIKYQLLSSPLFVDFNNLRSMAA